MENDTHDPSSNSPRHFMCESDTIPLLKELSDEAADNCNKFFVLARTEMGKSSTVEKLVAATEQSKTQDQDSKEPKIDSIQPIEEDKLAAAATKSRTEQSETQDQDSKEPKMDSVQPIEEDKLAAAATKSRTEQSETQDQDSKEPKMDSVQPIEEDKLVPAATKNWTEQSETQYQDSKEPKMDSVQPIEEDKMVAAATKNWTEQSKTQDQDSMEPKIDSIQPIEEDKLVTAATKNQTEQSKTQDQDSKEPKMDSIQPIEDLPAEAAPDSCNSYYDILVLGRTGMGKSTTVDKLIAATVKNQTEQGEYQDQGSKEPKSDPKENTRWLQDELQHKNLKATVMSEPRCEAEEKKSIEKRLENIVCSRNSKEKTHIQINKFRAQDEGDKCQESCQLLENCETNIRVLDPPGFYGPELLEGATSTWNSNFMIVRQIVRLQAIKGLNFTRILYWLPLNGPLKRSDQALQEEIQKLALYFGRSIFKHLVLVGTMPQHFSKKPALTEDTKFPQTLKEKSRTNFHEALEREFERRKEDTAGLPRPPIIFISMTDTCEEILEKVMSAPVESNGTLQLQFHSNTCSKCGIETGINSDNIMVCEYRKPGQTPWANAKACEETRCHPNIVPIKTIKSVLLGFCTCRWKFTEDLCINCNKGADHPGCMQVNAEFNHQGTTITVMHSSRLDD